MPTEPPPPVVEPARAKLNLYLHVVGRRDDGYHLLDSLVAFAEFGDDVAAAAAETLTLAVDGPFAAALADESDNLVLRAARALAAAAGRPARAALRLTKRLPVASGLGGGSADAAAALRALARLWGVAPPPGLAATLGADVPACLAGAPAFVGGVGERLDAAPALPRTDVVLVNPRVALATPDVFAARTGAFSASARFAAPPRDGAALAALLRERRNDLTPASVQLAPAIASVLVALERSPGCLLARMSGSGATCFGLYADARAATVAAATLARERPDWWIAATRFADG